MKSEAMHIVVIGNGVAGNTACSAIRKFDRNSKITIISKEDVPEYSPCVLPNYLSGEMERERVFLKTLQDYSDENIHTIFGQKAVQIDIKRKKVFLKTKKGIYYDKLIIATGSKPIVPSIEGVDKKGIFTLRSLGDANKIANYAGRKVVVFGPGYIGVEVSIALKKRGWEVSLVGGRTGRILRPTFDEKPALILRKIIEEHGVEVLTAERIVKFNGNICVRSVITDKRKIECDMVILVLGVRPDVELAQQAGLELGEFGGIRTDEHMMTSVKDVYACGDCIESKDMTTGKYALSLLWPSAKQQGAIAGYNCIGIHKSYPGFLRVSGVNIFGTYAASIGSTMGALKNLKGEVIEKNDGHYCRLVIVDGVLVGAQAIDRIEDMGILLSVIRRKDGLAQIKGVLNNKKLLTRNLWYYKLDSYMI